jgi:hypothetical protein
MGWVSSRCAADRGTTPLLSVRKSDLHSREIDIGRYVKELRDSVSLQEHDRTEPTQF